MSNEYTIEVVEETNEVIVSELVDPASEGGAFLRFLGAVTGRTGGGAANLDGLATLTTATPHLYAVVISGLLEFWRLEAGTDAEDVAAGIVRPDDYAAATNEKIFKRVLFLA